MFDPFKPPDIHDPKDIAEHTLFWANMAEMEQERLEAEEAESGDPSGYRFDETDRRNVPYYNDHAKGGDSQEIGWLGALIITVVSMFLAAFILDSLFGLENIPGFVIFLVWIGIGILILWIVSKLRRR